MSPEHYNLELETIYQIAENNGYPIFIIKNILRKLTFRKTLESPRSPTRTDKIYRKLSFVSDQYNRPITNLLRKQGITPAHYNNFNLYSLLVNNKIDKLEPGEKCGVYRLECEDYDSFYIGQTGRTFQTRYKEHMGKLHSNANKVDAIQIDSTSAFADHLIKNNHSF